MLGRGKRTDRVRTGAKAVLKEVAMLIVTMAGKSLSYLAGTLSRVARAVNHRRAIRELAHLDTRGLKDIGLTRADVTGALAAPWFQDPSRILAERSGAGRAAAARRGIDQPAVKAAVAAVPAIPANTVACSA